jgi:hypothetical protein
MNRCRRVRLSVSVALACAALALSYATAAAQPQVVSVSPARESIQADYHTDIFITFDERIDTASLGPNSVRVFGHWSGPMAGAVSGWTGGIRFEPAGAFFAGERVTVAVSRDVENRSGQAMGRSYTWYFWVRTAPGTLDLTSLGTVPIRQPGEDWIQSYGAYGGDLDNDGCTDMLIPNEQSGDVRRFLNDGAGNYSTFAITTVPNGASPSTNEGADFDNDGEIDVVIGSALGSTVGVLLGDGTGGWKSSNSYASESSVRGVGVVDLDGDGWDDIVTANRFGDTVAMLMNQGDGTFGAPRFVESGGGGEFGLAVADADNDGFVDVFIGAYNTSEIVLLTSDGVDSLAFSDKVTVTGRPWMLAVGDMNNDGNVDVVSANATGDVVTIVFGDGAGNLSSPATFSTGGFPLAIDVGDIDGDGDLEFISSNYDGVNWTLYENLGGGTFGNARTLTASRAGSCATLHDRDNDLDLDVTGIDELDDLLFIFDNQPDPSAAANTPAAGVRLLPNHPNPFNPVTTVRFALDAPAHALLVVHDVEGRIVRVLADREFAAGVHGVTWDGRNGPGERVGSGVYFCVLRAGGVERSRKMTMLK